MIFLRRRKSRAFRSLGGAPESREGPVARKKYYLALSVFTMYQNVILFVQPNAPSFFVGETCDTSHSVCSGSATLRPHLSIIVLLS